MPVIINEIEVLEEPPRPAAAPPTTARTPAAPPAAALSDTIRRIQRDLDGRQRRLVAD
jgi:hypothetical protein